MKLIDRDKFLKDKDYPTGGERYYNTERGEHPERVYECNSNMYKMTLVEALWLNPEYNMTFGKYHKPNIFWLILYLFCPWVNVLCDCWKEGFNLSIANFMGEMMLIFLTLIGMGPIFAIIIKYRQLKRAHVQLQHDKSFKKKEDFLKYAKIKIF